jgi:hypothetical protein
MKWIRNDDKEEKILYGNGTVYDSVELPLPKRPSLLLLNKVANDAFEVMRRQFPVCAESAVDRAHDEIAVAAQRLIEVARLMPAAYDRAVKADEPFRSVRELCGIALMAAWKKLKL